MSKEAFRDSDLMAFAFIADPQLAPDGKRVAYVRTHTDRQENKYRSRIHVVAADAAAPHGAADAPRPPFTGGPGRDFHPRWSPDGQWLAFLSDRDAAKGAKKEEGVEGLGPQIYVMPTLGGEARRVTDLRGGVGNFCWSPDSGRIAFTARLRPDGPSFVGDSAPAASASPDATGAERAASPAAANGRPGSPAPSELDDTGQRLFQKYNHGVKVIERIHYRQNGIGYLEDKRSQVLVLDLRATLLAGETRIGSEHAYALPHPVQVTHGDFDHGMPSWSPNGREIAVAACRAEDADMQHFSDIWVFPADGRGEPRKLTRSSGPAYSPAWSPDGSQIVYLGHERELEWYSDMRLWRVAADGAGAPTCLTAAFPRQLGDASNVDMRMGGGEQGPFWSRDGKRLLMLTGDRGTTHLYAIDAETGVVTRLTQGDVVIYGISVDTEGGRFACTLATPAFPGDLFTGRLPAVGSDPLSDPTTGFPAQGDDQTAAFVADGTPLTRVTRANEALLSQRQVALPERFRFRAEGGPEVDGWALRPAGTPAAGPIPTLLEIHGGPMTMYTSTFYFEFQRLAAAGFGIVWTNPRGSQGYGQEFCAGIQGDWGNHDYADIMAGVDAALERFPWIDRDRLGVLGGSYGGYMTSWIIGHTQRFKAACAMRSVTNTASFFGTSDTGFHWDVVFGGTPWDNPESHRRQSPITYAGNMRTPTLIIHSEQDYRCLMEQDEQLYVALKKQGVEARLVRYPDETHELSRSGQPWHRVHRMGQIVSWFVEHLRP